MQDHTPFYVPSDSTAFYTLVLAIVAVGTIIVSARLSWLDRRSRSKERDADWDRERAAALATADAIIRAVLKRISAVIDEDMAIDNKMPLGGEASLSAFAVRLLQPDIAACFGSRYEEIAAAALEIETWSHALQHFRELALAVQQRALDRSQNDTDVLKFVSAREHRVPTQGEIQKDMVRYRRDYAAQLTLAGTRQYSETLSADLARIRAAVAAANDIILEMQATRDRA
jgi:hypothetical protein